MLQKNSPKGKWSKQDFQISLDRLIWAIVGVIATWLGTDLPETVGDDTFFAYAISGVSLYVGSLLVRLINDYSKGGTDDSENEGAD